MNDFSSWSGISRHYGPCFGEHVEEFDAVAAGGIVWTDGRMRSTINSPTRLFLHPIVEEAAASVHTGIKWSERQIGIDPKEQQGFTVSRRSIRYGPTISFTDRARRTPGRIKKLLNLSSVAP